MSTGMIQEITICPKSSLMLSKEVPLLVLKVGTAIALLPGSSGHSEGLIG